MGNKWQQHRKEIQDIEPGRSRELLSVAAVFVLLGGVLLLAPGIALANICIALGGLAIVAGIVVIVKYFIAESYKNINDYGFSEGVMFVLAGIFLLVQTKLIVGIFPMAIALAVLATGIIKLQTSMDLLRLGDPRWWLHFLANLLVILLAALILFGVFQDDMVRNVYSSALLIVDGVLSVVSIIHLRRQISRYCNAQKRIGEDSDWEGQKRISDMEEEERDGAKDSE